MVIALVVVALMSLPEVAQARTCPRGLPVSAQRSTSDTRAFQDRATVTLRARSGHRVRDVRVMLLDGTETVATGARQARFRTRASSALRFARPLRVGPHRFALSGRVEGCRGRRRVTHAVDFRHVSLDVVARRSSTLAGSYPSHVTVFVANDGDELVRDVRASLVDSSGATVASIERPDPIRTVASIPLPLGAPLRPGDYELVIAARAGSETERFHRETLAFGAAEGPAHPEWPGVRGALGGSERSGINVQAASVDWQDSRYAGRDRAGFVVPGIGRGEVVCSPDTQWLRILPSDPGRETALMNWTYKDWSEHREFSLREAVRTRFTGADFNEGFNKFGPRPEIRSTGSFIGIVSDRLRPDGPGGPGAAPTTIRLSWSWDFSDPAASRCLVSASVFSAEAVDSTAESVRSVAINWRGETDAQGRDQALTPVPGLGSLRIACVPGPAGARVLELTPVPGVSSAQITTHEGSETSTLRQDVGPFVAPLPNNGMLTARFKLPDGRAGAVMVTSRWKVNDPDPAQNSCHVAGQVLVGPPERGSTG